MKQLAAWWDRFATTTVNDVRHVHGAEAASSAEHVADALATWRQRGEAAADLGFWRQHLDNFRTPKAFALVVDSLLRKHDYRAAMALLMNWLAQAEEVSLEDGTHSFHALALRWMLAVCGPGRGPAGREEEPPAVPEAERWPLARKFLDYLEANAEDFGSVPRLGGVTVREEAGGEPVEQEEEEEALYGAAYEGVTYRDSTDDDVESEVLDIMPREAFDLEEQGPRLEQRLRFLATSARLWHIATRAARAADAQGRDGALQNWLGRASKNYKGLLELLDAIHAFPIPEPSGAYDSLVEFDRRRVLKEQLLGGTITTCMETAFAVGALRGALGEAAEPPAEGKAPAWEPVLIRLEQALWRGDAGEARRLLPDFARLFRTEPLLFTPLSDGGSPRLVLRVSIAQMILRALVANLPRIGLLRETYELLRLAWDMERRQELAGQRVTEFDRLFQVGCQAVVEAVVESAARARPEASEKQLVKALELVMEPLLALWVQHSNTLRVAVLEPLTEDEAEWDALREFIRRYGADLFHARFMTLGNLRGVLHRGVGAYLDYLAENEDPLHPIRLVQELGRQIGRAEAERRFQTVLQAVIENYEEYKDYNTTTPQSDYGENLYTLLDFLRLKASYERDAWRLRPVVLAHEVLARQQSPAAEVWQEQVAQLTGEQAAWHLEELAELEKEHGMHLRTVADRLGERFVRPLALDRLCAMMEPAMAEARRGGPGEAFARLERELEAYAATTSGVGLDVPHWLRRLEAEVHRVQQSRTAIASLAENLFQIPRVPVPLDELRRQFEGWKKGRKRG
jgi:hypothetical protein